MIEDFKNLFDKISGHYSYNTENKEFTFDSLLTDYAIPLLNAVNFERRRNKSIVQKENLPFAYFDSYDEFISEVVKEDLDQNIIIANYNNSIFTYLVDEGKSYKDFKEFESYLISNAIVFFQSKIHFQNQSTHNEFEFEFVDFYSESARKIIFSSLIDKKRVGFVFPQAGIIELDENIDFRKSYNDFINGFNTENKTFPIFLKKSLISNLYLETKNSYKAFFDKLEIIIKEAKLNFNVYLHELSFDDMKKDYEEYKTRYFKEQTEMLSKLSNQVIALPVSLAGTLFALYKMKESLTAVIIVLIGLALFLFYMSYIVSIYKNDLSRLIKQIEKDFDKLYQHKFFQQHKEEFHDLGNTKNWLIRRAKNLRTGLISYSIIVWLLNISVMVFSYFMYNPFELNAGFLCIVSWLIILIAIINLITFSEKKEKETTNR